MSLGCVGQDLDEFGFSRLRIPSEVDLFPVQGAVKVAALGFVDAGDLPAEHFLNFLGKLQTSLSRSGIFGHFMPPEKSNLGMIPGMTAPLRGGNSAHSWLLSQK